MEERKKKKTLVVSVSTHLQMDTEKYSTVTRRGKKKLKCNLAAAKARQKGREWFVVSGIGRYR